jgi:hypothetical protein
MEKMLLPHWQEEAKPDQNLEQAYKEMYTLRDHYITSTECITA